MGLLSYYLEKNIIILKSNDKWNALKEMVKVIFHKKDIRENILHTLIEKEKLCPNGIGGVAVPHVRAEGIHGIYVVLGKSSQGIEYNSLDKGLVYLILLVVAPELKWEEMAKIKAKAWRVFKNFSLRNACKEANSPKEIFDLIKKEEDLLDN